MQERIKLCGLFLRKVSSFSHKNVKILKHGNPHSFTSGCGTWSLTLREEHRLRVFENRVLRRIFGPKRDEVTGDWRKLHNEELHNLYSSPNIIRMMRSRRVRWAGHVARVKEKRNVYWVFMEKARRKETTRKIKT
jgi:hypothetical protein